MREDNLHFVKIMFEGISQDEMEILLNEDERVNSLFADPATVDYDGYERGTEDFVMYFYGTDADRMASLIVPQLTNCPFINRAMMLKRYGGHGAREETTSLL